MSGKQALPVDQSAKVTKSLLSRATASEHHCTLDGRERLLRSQYIALKGNTERVPAAENISGIG